jgi:ubiquinone/menaquinone biosynthesis C-methylase UbiE
MSLYGPIFTTLYDPLLARGERAGMRSLRGAVLAEAHGEVLEIGAGTGLNLDAYPGAVRSLALTDTEPSMVRRLERRAADLPMPTTVTSAPAEALPFADDSFDTVVSTLVLCTVTDVGLALDEIRRVLRPTGRLALIEHVRASDRRVARWQDRLHGPWLRFGNGCHCNRDTSAALEHAGFTTNALSPARWLRMPRIVSPLIAGSATP